MNELKPGDHIYSYRKAYTYCHHGIFEGNGMVIHFTGNMVEGSSLASLSSSSSHPKTCSKCGYQTDIMGVIRTCFDCFLNGSTNLYLYEYNKCDPPEQVVNRALYLHGKQKGFGDYSLTKNNCEDFAIYCKTECLMFDENNNKVSRSTQIRKANSVIETIGHISPIYALISLITRHKYTERKISVDLFYEKYRYLN
ncbi:unnamed protein product [Amaranthus hypochondriacus]